MASAIIHLAVAKQLINNLNVKNRKDYYLGSIAPDIAKQIGRTKEESHFLYGTGKDVPNIKMFVEKYPDFKENDFNLGYFIHLYTDVLWFTKFLPEVCYGSSLKLIDGTFISATQEEIQSIIYSDYTNINTDVIDEYNMDLSLFYEEFQVPKTTLDEIPVEKLDILLEQMGLIIEQTKVDKHYTFDIITVKNFINDTTKEIIEELKKY